MIRQHGSKTINSNHDEHSKHLYARGKSQKQPVHTLLRQEKGAMVLKKYISMEKNTPWVTRVTTPPALNLIRFRPTEKIALVMVSCFSRHGRIGNTGNGCIELHSPSGRTKSGYETHFNERKMVKTGGKRATTHEITQIKPNENDENLINPLGARLVSVSVRVRPYSPPTPQ